MRRITSSRSVSQLIELKSKDVAELDRLMLEQEYLNRRLKINLECIDFIKFMLQQRETQIAENSHIVEPWSVGYYSHDAD